MLDGKVVKNLGPEREEGLKDVGGALGDGEDVPEEGGAGSGRKKVNNASVVYDTLHASLNFTLLTILFF